MHPPPHSASLGIPSYASLVGSVDVNAVKYVAASRAQDGKREDIMDLENMCLVRSRIALSFLILTYCLIKANFQQI
jgi:hypothetical protein